MPEEKFKGLPCQKNNLTRVSVVPAFDDLVKYPEEVIKKAKSYGAASRNVRMIPHDEK